MNAKSKPVQPPKTKSNAIALCCTAGWIPLAAITLLSCTQQGAAAIADFYVLVTDANVEQKAQFASFCRQHGFSATCYVVSQRVGRTNEWDSQNGIAQTPLMNAGHLRQWVDGGQEIGAHTRHHADLTQADAVTARDEIFGSKVELEQMIGQSVIQFCYPYGNFSDAHADLVREAGFSCATTTVRSRCLAGEDLVKLPRAPVVRSTTLFGLWQKVATAYEDRRRLS